MRTLRALFAALPLLAAASAMAAETTVPAGTDTEITVYAGDLALVRDHRVFRLAQPESRLAFAGVSS